MLHYTPGVSIREIHYTTNDIKRMLDSIKNQIS